MNVIIDGLNIEYTEKGEGIPVLLLHGWGSSYDVYGAVRPLPLSGGEFSRLRRL